MFLEKGIVFACVNIYGDGRRQRTCGFLVAYFVGEGNCVNSDNFEEFVFGQRLREGTQPTFQLFFF